MESNKYIQKIRSNLLFFLISGIAAILDIFSKYVIFSVVCKAIIFVPIYIASVPLEFQKSLDDYRVSPELKVVFEKHGHKLSSGASVKKNLIDQDWWIYDGSKKYMISSSEAELDIYTTSNPIPENYNLMRPCIFVPGEYRHITVIPNFFSLRIAFNLGAIWSSFHGRTLMLTIGTILAMAFIFYVLFRNDNPKSYQTSLGFIMAGAVGNLWDRISFGGVRDFLDFYVSQNHWPTFNFADIWIVIGIALFILLEWKRNKAEAAQNREESKKK